MHVHVYTVVHSTCTKIYVIINYGCNVNTTIIVDFNLDLEQQHLLVNMLKPGDPSEGR